MWDILHHQEDNQTLQPAPPDASRERKLKHVRRAQVDYGRGVDLPGANLGAKGQVYPPLLVEGGSGGVVGSGAPLRLPSLNRGAAALPVEGDAIWKKGFEAEIGQRLALVEADNQNLREALVKLIEGDRRFRESNSEVQRLGENRLIALEAALQSANERFARLIISVEDTAEVSRRAEVAVTAVQRSMDRVTLDMCTMKELDDLKVVIQAKEKEDSATWTLAQRRTASLHTEVARLSREQESLTIAVAAAAGAGIAAAGIESRVTSLEDEMAVVSRGARASMDLGFGGGSGGGMKGAEGAGLASIAAAAASSGEGAEALSTVISLREVVNRLLRRAEEDAAAVERRRLVDSEMQNMIASLGAQTAEASSRAGALEARLAVTESALQRVYSDKTVPELAAAILDLRDAVAAAHNAGMEAQRMQRESTENTTLRISEMLNRLAAGEEGATANAARLLQEMEVKRSSDAAALRAKLDSASSETSSSIARARADIEALRSELRKRSETAEDNAVASIAEQQRYRMDERRLLKTFLEDAAAETRAGLDVMNGRVEETRRQVAASLRGIEEALSNTRQEAHASLADRCGELEEVLKTEVAARLASGQKITKAFASAVDECKRICTACTLNNASNLALVDRDLKSLNSQIAGAVAAARLEANAAVQEMLNSVIKLEENLRVAITTANSAHAAVLEEKEERLRSGREITSFVQALEISIRDIRADLGPGLQLTTAVDSVGPLMSLSSASRFPLSSQLEQLRAELSSTCEAWASRGIAGATAAGRVAAEGAALKFQVSFESLQRLVLEETASNKRSVAEAQVAADAAKRSVEFAISRFEKYVRAGVPFPWHRGKPSALANFPYPDKPREQQCNQIMIAASEQVVPLQSATRNSFGSMAAVHRLLPPCAFFPEKDLRNPISGENLFKGNLDAVAPSSHAVIISENSTGEETMGVANSNGVGLLNGHVATLQEAKIIPVLASPSSVPDPRQEVLAGLLKSDIAKPSLTSDDDDLVAPFSGSILGSGAELSLEIKRGSQNTVAVNDSSSTTVHDCYVEASLDIAPRLLGISSIGTISRSEKESNGLKLSESSDGSYDLDEFRLPFEVWLTVNFLVDQVAEISVAERVAQLAQRLESTEFLLEQLSSSSLQRTRTEEVHLEDGLSGEIGSQRVISATLAAEVSPLLDTNTEIRRLNESQKQLQVCFNEQSCLVSVVREQLGELRVHFDEIGGLFTNSVVDYTLKSIVDAIVLDESIASAATSSVLNARELIAIKEMILQVAAKSASEYTELKLSIDSKLEAAAVSETTRLAALRNESAAAETAGAKRVRDLAAEFSLIKSQSAAALDAAAAADAMAVKAMRLADSFSTSAAEQRALCEARGSGWERNIAASRRDREYNRAAIEQLQKSSAADSSFISAVAARVEAVYDMLVSKQADDAAALRQAQFKIEQHFADKMADGTNLGGLNALPIAPLGEQFVADASAPLLEPSVAAKVSESINATPVKALLSEEFKIESAPVFSNLRSVI